MQYTIAASSIKWGMSWRSGEPGAKPICNASSIAPHCLILVNAKQTRRLLKISDSRFNSTFDIRHLTFLPRWVLFAAVFCHPLRSDDWPGWRGPHHDGISRETNWTARWPAEGPPQLWRAEVGTGFSSVAVAGDRLFTLGNSNEIDTVFAFAAGSGKLLWKYSYACPSDPEYYEGGPGSTPTVDGQTVYTLSKRGHLF